MDLLTTILLLLFCLLISNIISHYIPSIPTALTQIATGIILALIFVNLSFEMEAEWFLLLFIAPLLYNDGRHFSREELWEMRGPILGNAIILVIITTIGGGYFIHGLIPDIPLAAAFALAAILSPTDPVAVNGIAKRIQIPQKILSLVRGESLINDASGLVAFNYAIAAVITGYFSLPEAIIDFSYKFLAGAVLGIMLGFLVTLIRFTLRKQGIIDATFHSLLQVLTPFIVYIITEEFLHASGIIGVVTAGIVHSLVRERTETMIADEQVLTEHIWSLVLFVLNGVVFLLLGLNIPSSMAGAVVDPNIDNWLLIGYVVIIGAVILAIRFGWSYFFYELGLAKDAIKPDLRTHMMISLTGVRGAVTMAGVLSLPYFLMNGDPFPQRSLILFIAAGVILFTLVVATLFLPVLSKREPVAEEGVQTDLSEAKSKILLEVIKRIKLETNSENQSVSLELINEYKARFSYIQAGQNSQELLKYQEKTTAIRLMALKKERDYLQAAMDRQKLSGSMFAALEKSLDRREEALTANGSAEFVYLLGRVARAWRRWKGYFNKADKESDFAKLRLSKDLQVQALQAAYSFLEKYAEEQEPATYVYAVVLDYKRMIDRLRRPVKQSHEQAEEQKEEMRLKLIDIERAEIHSMFEAGEITREQAKELRRFVNNIESVALYEHVE